MGIPKIQNSIHSNHSNGNQKQEKSNLMLRKLNESHHLPQPVLKKELEPNNYAMSPYAKVNLDQSKQTQSSQPVISHNKLQKNFIFKRVKNRISKDSKQFKGRVSSAFRRSSQITNLDISTSGRVIDQKRIRSL